MPYSITITADTLDELLAFRIARAFAAPGCKITVTSDKPMTFVDERPAAPSAYPTPAPHSDQYPPFKTWESPSTVKAKYVDTGDAIAKAVDLSKLDAKIPDFTIEAVDFFGRTGIVVTEPFE